MSKKHGPEEDPLEPLAVRAVIEEHNANVFVENFLYNSADDMRMVWIRFFAQDSNADRVLHQLKTISKDFNIQLIVFAVGRSYYLSYSSKLDEYYKVKSWKTGNLTLTDMERLKIPASKVFSKVKNMFLEDRWRQIIYEEVKNAQ